MAHAPASAPFAPTNYQDQEHLDALRIDFAQLPFEIYELTK